ncbi:BA14K family protein [Cohaesibacter haloalkalitolerans]|uniref:BA14K family protein n=1 Tax=Cohaesibacter haloalkalitolerans TaxID=1162980 RepID=UPI000E65BBA3|nr:BA14K family protein [Cohaesibacter haloalkalitolerans]
MIRHKIMTLAMIAALGMTAAITGPAPQAQAKDGKNAALATGIVVGTVAGAIAMNAVKDNKRPVTVHRAPPPPKHYAPAPRKDYAPRRDYAPRKAYAPNPPRYHAPNPRSVVMSREQIRRCSERYRSFNPRTGYYTGYDGRKHLCTLR